MAVSDDRFSKRVVPTLAVVHAVAAVFLSLSAGVEQSLPIWWLAIVLALCGALLANARFVAGKPESVSARLLPAGLLVLLGASWSVAPWLFVERIGAASGLVTPALLTLTAATLVVAASRLTIASILFGVMVLAGMFMVVPPLPDLALITVPLVGAWVLGICLIATTGRPETSASAPAAAGSDLLELQRENEQLRAATEREEARRRSAESMLAQAKMEAESAAMAKDEFLATMSHEIRTPLNGILPILELLRGTELDDTQRDYLQTAFQSSRHLLSIIDDILDYSKIEAGKLELETVGINLRELLHSVTRLMSGTAERKNVALRVHIDPDVRLAMRGDPVRLRQILTNLVGNAVKFTQKGYVEIKVSKRREMRTKSELLFTVKDTGVGMDEEAARKLFQPFTQADASTTRLHGGTGLGLVICKRLVEMMGGRIGVKSAPGRGSIFWFTVLLRKSVGDIQGRGLDDARALVLSRGSVDPVTSALGKIGVEFELAPSPADAMAKLRSTAQTLDESLELLVIDLQSMSQSGVSFARAVRREPRLRETAILLIGDELSIPDTLLGQTDVACVAAPATSQSVEAALAELFGLEGQLRTAPDVQEPVSAADLPAAPSSFRGRALIVEDNPVNLHVAQKLLGLLQLEFDTAKHGREALAALEQRDYDVVLMDCMMPVMDGYAATRALREKERAGGLRRTPVIAMTANAMAGDRQRCLDAGMDDYMAKPLNRKVLENTLAQWFGGEKPTPPQPEPESAKPEEASVPQLEIIDENVLGDLVDLMGDELDDLIAVYLEDSPKSLAELERAAAQDDQAALIAPAHSLKSTSANLGVMGLSKLAKEIEHGARSGTAADVGERVEQMQRLFEKASHVLMARMSEGAIGQGSG